MMSNKYYWQDKEPTLREFKNYFDHTCDDILGSDKNDPYIMSHKIVGKIYIDCINDDTETIYEIIGLDVGQLIGCGCGADIIIQIKKVNEDQ